MVKFGISLLVAAVFVSACASPDSTPDVPADAKVKDLYIVDCLLPGQLRQLGATTYMTPRRPVRTTAVDCRVRGGEYVAYDRADYKTALKIWLPEAENGDAEAQNTVGEIFEQGLGTEPNYEVAVLWYKKAADQGHKGALFNLGTLYEMGRGVPQDKVAALNLYRQAWGVSEDELTYRSEAEGALLAQAEVNAELANEVEAAKTEASIAKAEAEAARADAEVARAEAEAARQSQQRVAAAPGVKPETSQPVSVSVQQTSADAKEVTAAGRNFGRYYALMIGNNDYQFLNQLDTPVSDVGRLAKVLEQQYGFNVKTVTNGDDASLLQALNQLNDVLKPEDNLFIYYSGHGNSRRSGSLDVGYWLPVNAQLPPNDTYWVPTEQVSGHLARLQAKRIIVVADSAFAGLLADNPAFLLTSDPALLKSEAYVSLRFPNRSRLLFTSGTDAPLPQTDNASSSVFADAFISALVDNKTVLTAPALYLNVMDALESRQPDLNPQFKAIKRAGDEVGDFFFVSR